jgi:transcriptional regulator with XRE-family HTH domain
MIDRPTRKSRELFRLSNDQQAAACCHFNHASSRNSLSQLRRAHYSGAKDDRSSCSFVATRRMYMQARTTPQERARPGRRRRTVKEHGPDPADVHVGSRLRLARGLLGLSQVQVAQSLGVSFQAVQKYERGEIRVSASRLLQASRLLGQPLEFFFEGLDSPSSNDGDKGEFVRAELELLRAFRALPNDELQRQILRLVRSMGRALPAA